MGNNIGTIMLFILAFILIIYSLFSSDNTMLPVGIALIAVAISVKEDEEKSHK